MLFSPAKNPKPAKSEATKDYSFEEIEADPDLLPETKRKKLGKLQWI